MVVFAAIVDWRVAVVAAVVLAAGGGLAFVTFRLLAAARPESPALIRLEVMSLRAWRRADEAGRAALLEAAEAEPIEELVRRPMEPPRVRVEPEESRPVRRVPRDPERLTPAERVATITSLRRDESAELPAVDEVDFDDDWLVVTDDDRGRGTRSDDDDNDGGPIDPLL